MNDSAVRRILLQVHETVGGCSAGTTALSVYCPDQVKSVGIELCARCPSIAKIRAKKLDGFVECRSPSEDELAERRPVDGVPDMGARAARLPVGEVMNRNLLCVHPETSLEATRTLLQERALEYVSVVDERGAAIGILAQAGLPPPSDARRTVGEIMTPYLRSVREDCSLAHAFAVMALHRLPCIPIVSTEGNVVGLFTASDALPWLTEESGDVVPDQKDELAFAAE